MLGRLPLPSSFAMASEERPKKPSQQALPLHLRASIDQHFTQGARQRRTGSPEKDSKLSGRSPHTLPIPGGSRTRLREVPQICAQGTVRAAIEFKTLSSKQQAGT